MTSTDRSDELHAAGLDGRVPPVVAEMGVSCRPVVDVVGPTVE